MQPALHYRPDIDGLRAVAILPVVLYHAGVPLMSGGFVGVDVFFVISGFLIAGIISREMDEHRFSLINFYERRARRILPALFVVIAATLAAGWMIAWPVDFIAIGESALATVLFGSNVYFWQTTDYFAAAAEYQPLLHTWSLAVEEQFYLVFPLLLLLLVKLPRAKQIGYLVAILVVSLAVSVFSTRAAPVTAFYLAPARAWELLAGVLLALNAVPAWQGRAVREFAAAAGLVLIVVSVVTLDAATPFPGIAAVMPCLGTALVIQAGRGRGAPTAVTRILSHRLPVFVGLISYSLYLWHWPLLAFSRSWLESPDLPAAWALACVLASVGLAVVSWRFVERPFRARAVFTREGVFRLAGAGALLLIALSVSILALRGVPDRFSPLAFDALAGVDDIEEDRMACMGHRSGSDYCRIGLAGIEPSVMLLGDSHAAALMSAVGYALEQQGQSGFLASHGACPPLLGVERIGYRWSDECSSFVVSALDFIAQRRASLHTVILAARWPLYVTGEHVSGETGGTFQFGLDAGAGEPGNAAVVDAGLSALIHRAREIGVRVIILGGVPEIGWNVPRTIASVARRGGELPAAPTLSEVGLRHETANAILQGMAGPADDIAFVPIAPLLCEPECMILDGTKPIYVDDDHLSRHGAYDVLGPRLALALDGMLNAAPANNSPTREPG